MKKNKTLKKKIIYLMGMILTLTILVSCSSSTNQTGEQTTGSEDVAKAGSESTSTEQTTSEEGADSDTVKEHTVAEAMDMYNSWLEKQVDRESYALTNEYYGIFEIFGNPYYSFFSEDTTMYWYSALVSMRDDELLYLINADGEYPITAVGPLDEVDNWGQVMDEPGKLSAEEAIGVYNTWLTSHEDLASYTLNGEYYGEFELFGEPYYLFHTEDENSYWYNIMVHKNTGELLFMMISDGEHPMTSIELLDEWYEKK